MIDMVRDARFPLLSLASALVAVVLPLDGAGIKSGPMIGAATYFETTIWVQADGPAEVTARYWPIDDPEDVRVTDPIETEKATAFVAKLRADDQLRSGTTYGYEILLDGEVQEVLFPEGFAEAGESIPLTFTTPTNWRFREDGHTPFDFSIGFGSCYYRNDPETGTDRLGGRPYGSEFEIFRALYEKNPDAFVWLGDNVYLREDDWASRTGLHYRWTESRSLPELRPLLATTPQYATWDDHDYGPNDIGRAFWGKAATTEAFELFTANPSYGLPETPGIFSFFNWGDINFYLLDNRTYRTSSEMKTGDMPQMFGKAQIDWLIEMLVWAESQTERSGSSYPVSFHVICTGNQVLSPFSADNWSHYEGEFAYFRERLFAEGIDGVIFVSGDVHFGEASKQTFPFQTAEGEHEFTIFDLTTSSLTAGSWAGAPAEMNPHRWDIFPGENDRAGGHNFMLLRASGPIENRQLAIEYYNAAGELLNQKPGAPAGTVTDESIIRAQDFGRPF
jgi:alkaline phosphatase D